MTVIPRSELTVKLGQFVRKRRQDLGYTQQELADSTGFCRTYITDVELAGRNLSLENLHRLAMGLKLPLWRLIKLSELD